MRGILNHSNNNRGIHWCNIDDDDYIDNSCNNDFDEEINHTPHCDTMYCDP